MTTPDHDDAKKPSGNTVTLAVDGLSSDAHKFGSAKDDSDVITVEGTEVPASKAKQIIEQAATQGVRVFEKEN